MAVASIRNTDRSRLGLLWGACFALGCIAPSSGAEPIPAARIASPDASALGREAGAGVVQSTTASQPGRSATATYATAVKITSPCVLHAAEVDVRRKEERGPGGQLVRVTESARCSINAECVEQQGKPSKGDGFVSLACNGRACRCSVERLGLGASGAQKRSFKFSIDGRCSEADRAKALIVERCMPGMRLVAD